MHYYKIDNVLKYSELIEFNSPDDSVIYSNEYNLSFGFKKFKTPEEAIEYLVNFIEARVFLSNIEVNNDGEITIKTVENVDISSVTDEDMDDYISGGRNLVRSEYKFSITCVSINSVKIHPSKFKNLKGVE